MAYVRTKLSIRKDYTYFVSLIEAYYKESAGGDWIFETQIVAESASWQNTSDIDRYVDPSTDVVTKLVIFPKVAGHLDHAGAITTTRNGINFNDITWVKVVDGRYDENSNFQGEAWEGFYTKNTYTRWNQQQFTITLNFEEPTPKIDLTIEGDSTQLEATFSAKTTSGVYGSEKTIDLNASYLLESIEGDSTKPNYQKIVLKPKKGFRIDSFSGEGELVFNEVGGDLVAYIDSNTYAAYELSGESIKLTVVTSIVPPFIDLLFVGNSEHLDAGFYAKDDLNSDYRIFESIEMGEVFKAVSTVGYQLPMNGGSDQRIYISPKKGFEITSITVLDKGDDIDPLYFTKVYASEVYQGVLLGKGVYNTYRNFLEPVRVNIQSAVKPTTVAAYNRLYVMDSEKLATFALVGLYDSPEFSDIRRGDFIINVLHIPFEIPAEYFPHEESITIDGWDSLITASYLDGDVLEFDLGSIEIDMLGNSLDYNDAEYKLYLPFISNVVDISPTDVRGSISVKYVLDMYYGDLTVNVYGKDDSLLISFKSVLGRSIPIKMFKEFRNDLSSFSGINSGFVSPYVERITTELTPEHDTNLVNKFGKLLDVSGYVEITDIDLTGVPTFEEHSELISILKTGFFINE